MLGVANQQHRPKSDPFDGLHFDGLYSLASIVRSYGYRLRDENSWIPNAYIRREGSSFFKAHIWCRFTILVQTVVLVVTNLLKHIIRGTVYLVTGVLSFQMDRICLSYKDLLSGVIETVALPILGVISVIIPAKGAELAYRMAHHFNPDASHSFRSSQSFNYCQPTFYPKSSCYDIVRGCIACTVERLMAPLSFVATSVAFLVQDIFSCNFTRATVHSMSYLIISPFSPILGSSLISQMHGIEPIE